MPGFANIAALAGADAAGRTSFCSFRKVPGQVSVAGNWFDLSMAAGNPLPNYYATEPLVAAILNSDRGIYHGAAKSPASKHLTHIGVMTPTAAIVGRLTLLDYLLYYPFIDGDSSDIQTLDNSVQLPRYTDGEGVQIMAVTSAPTTGGGTMTVSYTDSDGNAQTSPIIDINTTAANIATIATSEQFQAAGGMPFVRLASGSRGVRSIQDVTMIAPSGGLLALVLVKPIASTVTREINTMHETEFVRLTPGAPRIYDGAYLNFILNPSGSAATGILTGYCKFAWST